MAGWARDLPEARVALVLCQSREAVASFFDGEETAYRVLVDESRDVARAYGVHVLLGLDSVNIARPATFVIDRSRVIRYLFVSSSQWEPTEEAPVRDAVVGLR